MRLLKTLYKRITTERGFFYNWEQRAFERRCSLHGEQLFRGDRSTGQFTCRFGRD